MAEHEEDSNGLEMTILKSLAIFSTKIHERWRSSRNYRKKIRKIVNLPQSLSTSEQAKDERRVRGNSS